jgi:hypothetical protein
MVLCMQSSGFDRKMWSKLLHCHLSSIVRHINDGTFKQVGSCDNLMFCAPDANFCHLKHMLLIRVNGILTAADKYFFHSVSKGRIIHMVNNIGTNYFMMTLALCQCQ